jgi:hypothetical protein
MSHSTYPIIDLTFIAAADLSDYQYYVVELGSTAGTVQLHTTTDKFAIGVLRNKPASGETAVVRILGVSECAVHSSGVAEGAAVGPYLSTDVPDGTVYAATAGEELFGRCIGASGTTTGNYATCLVNFMSPVVYTALV